MNVLSTHEPELVNAPCPTGCQWRSDVHVQEGIHLVCDDCGAHVVASYDQVAKALSDQANDAVADSFQADL